jgi:hypothetical protein
MTAGFISLRLTSWLTHKHFIKKETRHLKDLVSFKRNVFQEEIVSLSGPSMGIMESLSVLS